VQLQESLRQYSDLYDFAPVGYFTLNEKGLILKANLAGAALFGVERSNLINKPLRAFIAGESRTVFDDFRKTLLKSLTKQLCEVKLLRKGNLFAHVLIEGIVLEDKQESEKECRIAIIDITDRKQAEDALSESLAEKVALLKEIHHRVKNNLQIVASLLNLQARRVQDENAVNILQDTQSRVRSMALLHEMLYHSGNLAQINFVAYVEQLCGQLKRSFGSAAVQIRVENRVARISLPLEQSLPCGLILSELVSNALKHGFPGKRAGRIAVELHPREGQMLVLSVSDDGVGLPSGLDISNSSTLGLQLVSNLAAQLKGQFTVGRPDGGGTTISVVFPVPKDTLHEGEA
jgi:PAS domain S-box-containing protein